MNRTHPKRGTMVRDSAKLKLILTRPSFQGFGVSRIKSVVASSNKENTKEKKSRNSRQQGLTNHLKTIETIQNDKDSSLNKTPKNLQKKLDRSQSIKIENDSPILPNGKLRSKKTMSGFFPQLGGSSNRRQIVVDRQGPLQVKKYETKSGDGKSDDQQHILEVLVQRIIKQLCNKFYINQNNKTVYTIKLHKLTALLQYIIDVSLAKDTIKRSTFYPELYFLQYLLPKFQFLKHQNTQKKTINPDDYNLDDEVQKLKNTIEERQKIQQDISLLTITHKELSDIRENYFKTQLQLIKIQENVKQLSYKKESVETFLRQIHDTTDISAAISKKIKNYNFKEQNKDNYNKKCKQYKQTQNYMLDYATYLQNNKIQISFDYDSSSFEASFSKLKDKMLEIFKILDDKNKLQDNHLKIKYFIQDMLQLFTQKDSEMCRLCNLKTHCIRSFIRNVKMWLKNWQFKQDVLTNLKKMFVVSSVKMRSKIDDFKLSLKKSSVNDMLEGTKSEVEEINANFEEMVEYFKMGNAFY